MNKAQDRQCGCDPYLIQHNSWCQDTPVFAELTRTWGGNPFDAWPFIVFSLISAQTKGT